MKRTGVVITVVWAGFVVGCESPRTPAVDVGRQAESEPPPTVVLFSITSDASQDAQPLDMAMKLAGFSLDEGRDVALFFNVKGVNVPRNSFPDDLAFKDDPIKQQLRKLMERGAEVHVCPVCMKALGIDASEIMDGAQVTTRQKLFAKIGPSTAVFTY